MTVRVRVQNFQSISDATVEIDGLTVITGPNNSGKTALMRAIRAVFQNSSGTSFIREGQTVCAVTVDFGTYGSVRWSKGTGKRDRPTYVFDDKDPIYPGSAVPEELDKYGVKSIAVGGQDLWPTIAPQFTGQMFLIDRPGSVLAEAVADVDRVGLLNKVLRRSESERRSTAATLRVRLDDLASYQAEVESYEGLDAILEEIQRIRDRREKISGAIQLVDLMKGIHAQIRQTEGELAATAPLAQLGLTSTGALVDAFQQLETLIGLRSQLKGARADVERLGGVQDISLEVDAPKLRQGMTVLEALRQMRTRWVQAQQVLEQERLRLETAVADEVEARKLVDAYKAEIGACPLCGAHFREGA